MRAAAVLAATLLLLGCPGNEQRDVSQAGEPRTSTTTRNTQAVPENTATMNPVVPPHKELPTSRIPGAAVAPVEVQLTEYEIQMPDTLPAGHNSLKITNAGKENHNFAIEGPGIATKLASDLTRGDSATLDLDLKPGTYTVYCPVEDHRKEGMQRTLTVK